MVKVGDCLHMDFNISYVKKTGLCRMCVPKPAVFSPVLIGATEAQSLEVCPLVLKEFIYNCPKPTVTLSHRSRLRVYLHPSCQMWQADISQRWRRASYLLWLSPLPFPKMRWVRHFWRTWCINLNSKHNKCVYPLHRSEQCTVCARACTFDTPTQGVFACSQLCHWWFPKFASDFLQMYNYLTSKDLGRQKMLTVLVPCHPPRF